MKKFIISLIVLFTGIAAAQTPTFTPNIGLMVPAYGQQNWQVPTNFNWSLLDKLLSGNTALPGITVSGPANFAQLTSWQVGTTYPSGAIVAYLGTFYASLSSGNVGNLPTNATFWSTSIAGSGSISSLAIAVPSWLSSSCPSGSPLTGSGTCTITGTSETQNNFLAAPNGSNGVMSPRAIAPADLPQASNLALGAMKGDGTTITCTAGICSSNAGGSAKVIYASTISGVTPGVVVLPGSSASGTTDSASAINTAIAGGNIDLEVDSGFALSTSLILSSNTTIHCTSPQYGFIMQVASNAPILKNAHPEAPTTASGTGGFLVSNIIDQNIHISGCQLNENSTQAVTGNGAGSVPHMTNPATGLFVPGTFFIGVQNVTVDHNEVYDPGVFSIFFTNAENIHVDSNYIHVPQPPTLNKGTDGVHFIGPDKLLWVTNNRINAGDDSVAFNADDGNRPGSGDPNFTYTSSGVWLPVQWGPITDFVEDSNTLDACLYGGRLLSATELIDRGIISNLQGTCTDYVENISDPYTGLGPGNMGNIQMDNINVAVGAQTAGWGAAIPLNSTIQSLQIRGMHYTNPGSTNPIINHTSGTVGQLSLRDWDINSLSSSFTTGVALVGGSVTQLALSGINWNDGGSGHMVGGSVVPTFITCSDYTGPNRLLAGGFAPSIQNGDCFTNTYGSSVPNAIHFWPMNEGTGSTLHDNIGAVNLTASNVTWGTSTGMGTPAVAQFNGTTSIASAGSVDSSLNFNGTQPMSVCFWANYAASGASAETVVGNLETTGSYQGWEAGNGGAGLPPDFLVVGAVSSNQLTMISNTNVTASVGNLYCWTYDGSLASSGVVLYVNGSSQGLIVNLDTLTSGSTSTTPLHVGARADGSSPFQGALGYMRVWNSVLTSAEINTLYTNGPQ